MTNSDRVWDPGPRESPPAMGGSARRTMAPDEVAQLRRTFSGLDEGLNYVRGHAIYHVYCGYKAASKKADNARHNYDHAANRLRVWGSPEPGRYPRGPMGEDSRYYYQEDHSRLAFLATMAYQAAQIHAELRKSFNARYMPVLKAKCEY
ncbi:hypothetical protein BR93DRAFT_202048 [Coniochaeta sp. PMI_546]|nr:hypothetical protein BR93DRAFT_202048 [Coniochaeta sp. PMI_546]